MRGEVETPSETAPTPRKRLRCVISGEVQGVGFRWQVRERARDLGVTGYVHNTAENAVEVVAEGPENALEALKAFCYRGPDGATVSHVLVEESPATGDFATFDIRSERSA